MSMPCRKVPYASRSDAKAAIRAMRTRGDVGKGLGVYHCPRCVAWHVGHNHERARTPCRHCGVDVVVLPAGHFGPNQLRPWLVDADTEVQHRCPGLLAEWKAKRGGRAA